MDGSFPDLTFGLLRSRRGLLRSPAESPLGRGRSVWASEGVGDAEGADDGQDAQNGCLM